MCNDQFQTTGGNRMRTKEQKNSREDRFKYNEARELNSNKSIFKYFLMGLVPSCTAVQFKRITRNRGIWQEEEIAICHFAPALP